MSGKSKLVKTKEVIEETPIVIKPKKNVQTKAK
jgi:hypothetical protein